MAQTKTKKAKGSKKARANRSSANAKAARAKAARKPKATPHNGISNGIEGGAKAARDVVRGAGKDAAQVASKAKIPLLAGGAALVGTMGGVVIGSTHSGNKVLGISLPKRKRTRISSKDLAKAAKEVGRFGDNVGELGAEFRRVRQGLASNGEKQSSPLEVLLRGLTTRR